MSDYNESNPYEVKDNASQMINNQVHRIYLTKETSQHTFSGQNTPHMKKEEEFKSEN